MPSLLQSHLAAAARMFRALWQEACLQALTIIIIMIETAWWGRCTPFALPLLLRSTRALRSVWQQRVGRLHSHPAPPPHGSSHSAEIEPCARHGTLGEGRLHPAPCLATSRQQLLR